MVGTTERVYGAICRPSAELELAPLRQSLNLDDVGCAECFRLLHSVEDIPCLEDCVVPRNARGIDARHHPGSQEFGSQLASRADGYAARG